MKKRLLAILLSLMMVLSLLPVGVFAEDAESTNVAEVGGTGYKTLAEAVEKAATGETITLLKNVELEVTMGESGKLVPQMTVSGKQVTLDLAGHTIGYSAESKTKNVTGTPAVFAVMDGAELTVEGNGTIDAELGNNGSYGFNVNGGKLIINDGAYYGAMTAVQVQKGETVIKGGFFDLAKTIKAVNPGYSTYLINGIDANYKDGTAKVTISGGTFVKFNPNKSFSENPEADFLASGYGVKQDGDNYIVTEPVAAIGDTKYPTLSAAVAAADNATVTLLKDVTELETISITDGKKVDLNLNEKNITFKADNYFLVNNGALNVTGKGNITSSHGNDNRTWLPTIYAYGTDTDTADYSVVTIGKDVVIDNQGSYGLAIGHKNYKAYGAKVIVEGTVTSTYGFTVTGNAKAMDGNMPEITVTESGKIVSVDGAAIYAAGYGVYNIAGTLSGTEFGIEIRAGKLNVEDTAKISATGNFSDPVPNGNGSTVTGAAVAVSQHTTNLPIDVNIKGGEISETGKNGYALYEIDTVKNEKAENVAKDVSINIVGGSFNGNVYSTNNKLSITGGYFTSAPGASYLAEGKAVLTSIEPGYAFMVGDKPIVDVKPVAGDPVANVDKIKENDRDTVKTVAESIDDNGALAAAATQETANVTDTQKTSAENAIKATNSGVTVDESDTVTVYAQTYLDVTATAYDATKGIITLDIQPMSRIVATTADRASEIKVKGETADGETPNAVVLSNSEKKISIQTMTISIELPNDFTNENKVYVQHRGYEYEAAVTTSEGGKKIATFTNPHGFSEFTISVVSTAVAKVNGASYTTLQAAVDAAKDGETVEVTGGTTPYSATMSGSSRTITVKNSTSAAIVVTINGTKETIAVGETAKFSYTAPVYAPITKKDVKFDDVDVNAYYAPAVKWAVENKITAGKTDKLFAPDDTCTRGEMITFLWNAAGKPAAKNTTNPFTDVNAGAFYYDAVLWAVSNGITSGTSDTTFSPDDTVNRAQVVAFLYNYANKPAAANSTFSDVAADAYYAPAVGWAAAQKITSGTGNNTFSPENDCTRAQIVTFLYNDLAK